MKRVKNKKALSTIVIGAAVLSVGSVGFASWVISGGDASGSVDTIGVNVAGVSDQRIKMGAVTYEDKCVAGTGNDSSKTLVDDLDNTTKAFIVFGPKSGDNKGMIQAYGDGVNDLEHLSVKFKFTLSSELLETTLKSISITPTYPAILTSFHANGYVKNPSATSGESVTLFDSTVEGKGKNHSFSSDNISYTTPTSGSATGLFKATFSKVADHTVTVTVLAQWQWGSVFGGVNPGDVARDSSANVVSEAVSNLENMNSDISSAAKGGESATNVSFLINVAANSQPTA